MAVGKRLDPRHLVEDRRRGRRIFEVGTADQRARAVGAADDDAEAALRHLWHPPLPRAVMVEQRIAAGEQEGVGARALDRTSDVSGKSVSVRVAIGGSRIITKKPN